MDCRVCMAVGDFLVHPDDGVSQIGGFSHESEHDLAMMVSNFLENDSVGAKSNFHFISIQWIALCNISCIKICLVKLLRLLSYDAYHEYIDVVSYKDNGSIEQFIIDIDFRSHFEIARAIESYNRMLSSLPIIYMGSLTKLNDYYSKMLFSTISSFKQNSMPLTPWRSLDYLEAKWQSSY
ncbi:hypothetical protein PVL29_027167 [Vitis rotundifolia]|uniref:Uncharacterized protein n=1 Tax=Vitis rotundifolia TaxID=103349 RepID=A0AA38YII1_VITRO|nr:hypothetical protein PVL29_027167 [Vitis rotundifolia]